MKVSELLISIAKIETENMVFKAKQRIAGGDECTDTDDVDPWLLGQEFGAEGGCITSSVKSYVEDANSIISGFSERFYHGFEIGTERYHNCGFYHAFE